MHRKRGVWSYDSRDHRQVIRVPFDDLKDLKIDNMGLWMLECGSWFFFGSISLGLEISLDEEGGVSLRAKLRFIFKQVDAFHMKHRKTYHHRNPSREEQLLPVAVECHEVFQE